MQRLPFQLPDYCDPVEFDTNIFPEGFEHCTPPAYIDALPATPVNRVPVIIPPVMPATPILPPEVVYDTHIHSKWAFGFTTPTSAYVDVNSGYIMYGINEPLLVPGATIHIPTSSPVYIYVAYAYGSSDGLISHGSTAPVDSENTHRRLLHVWTNVGGYAVAASINYLGDIVIPGEFAG